MTLSQQVSSLEPSKRLKELGVKQDSYFYYRHNEKGEYELCEDEGEFCHHKIFDDEHWISAFTVAELGEMLAKRFDPLDSSLKTTSVPIFGGLEWVWYQNGEAIVRGDTEADARAKMLIYLLENKLIKL